MNNPTSPGVPRETTDAVPDNHSRASSAPLPRSVQDWLCRRYVVGFGLAHVPGMLLGVLVPMVLYARYHAEPTFRTMAEGWEGVLRWVEPSALGMICYGLGGLGMALHMRRRLQVLDGAGALPTAGSRSIRTMVAYNSALLVAALLVWVMHIAMGRPLYGLLMMSHDALVASSGGRYGYPHLFFLPALALNLLAYLTWFADFRWWNGVEGNKSVFALLATGSYTSQLLLLWAAGWHGTFFGVYLYVIAPLA